MPAHRGPVTRMETLSVAERLAEPDRCQEPWYRLAAEWALGKTVLDVGAGTGYGLDILRAAGGAAAGIDLLPLRGDITPTVIEQIPVKSYDLVVACDVIEHVEDDGAFLAALLNAAREAVFFSTPNWLHSHAENPYHFREYTPDELAALLGARSYRAWTLGPALPERPTPIARLHEAQWSFGILIDAR